MKTKQILAFFLIAHCSISTFAANDIYFSRIGVEQGLSQLSVMSIYQDEIGTMWFGTREGINRFNGNSMDVIQQIQNDKNSLDGVQIQNICGNKNGLVYIQTQNGLNQYDLRTCKISRINSKVDAISYGIRNLWIAEGNKLYAFDKNKKTLYCELPVKNEIISAILQTNNQRIILGTTHSTGVYIIDQNKKIHLAIKGCSEVSSIFEDSKSNIWIGTWQNGLYKIGRDGKISNYIPSIKNINSISSSFVRAICEDNNGFLWIGTKKGLDKMSVDSETFTHYGAHENSSRQLSNESIWSLMKDSQGTIWAGSYFGGVNYFNPKIDFFIFHDLQNGVFRSKPFPIISEIIEDNQNRLFLYTEGEGLIIYDPKTSKYKNFKSKFNNGLKSDNIKAGYYDKKSETLWLGTHLGGLSRFDVKTEKFTSIELLKGNNRMDIVRSIVPFENDLLISTYNGLFRYNITTNSASVFSENINKKIQYIVDVEVLGDYIWIGSIGLYRYNIKTGEIKSFFNKADDPKSLSNNTITKLTIDSKGRLWIGTGGSGINLFDKKTDSFIRFDSKTSEFKNDFVSNIMESNYGYIYVSTSQGLTILDVENKTTHNYSTENGFPLNSLFNGGMQLLSSGEIYIAGMNGLVSFREENLLTPQQAFNLNLINLWINNELVIPNDKTKILQTSLPFTKFIELNHHQTMLTIELASNNFIKENRPSYRYRLVGVSNLWTDLPVGITKLNFMNLEAGKYKLEVEGLSKKNGKVIASTSLNIRVYPPFYFAWYAYIFYLILVVFMVWRYIVFTHSKLLLETSLTYEKKEKEHLEEVNQSKLRFFTNISHEFRTPLTLIAGQLDMLLQMHNIQPGIYNRILNIKRHTHNMSNLINELLEFRKSEQGHLSIKVCERDLVKFVYEIYLSFTEYANYRQITLRFECNDDEIKLWFDPVQMQKVLYNLISNAFKYTPKNGNIKVIIEQNIESVSVHIVDSGIGISEDAIEKIFDRFYQVENGISINNMIPGTGIGLALSKNITEAHAAEIKVKSEPEIGSRFTVVLKKGKSHFPSEQIVDITDADATCVQNFSELDKDFMDGIVSSFVTNGEPMFSMLIVEDNDELRGMLQTIFEPIYKIYTAANGVEGLDITIEKQPDIVLSDVMMPLMSGSEMCSKIKKNFLVCHIPVVLLTAQTAIDFAIEGLQLGADDYITKPFDVKTLVVRCNNLVNGRKLLQEKYSKQIDVSSRQIATNNMDREFLEKAQLVIEKYLDNSEFDVPQFASEMALGRTKLFSKIKGITGQTPNDFIITVKMKKAAAMLTNNPEYNISDITYMLGFSSPKYFTKCFKEQFGVSPSAFRKGSGTGEESENEDAFSQEN